MTKEEAIEIVCDKAIDWLGEYGYVIDRKESRKLRDALDVLGHPYPFQKSQETKT